MTRTYYKPEIVDGFRKIPDMTRHGYRILRCWTHFGFCPVYKHNKTGKLIYFHEGKFCVGPEVLLDLEKNWEPIGHEEYMYYVLEMKNDLSVVFVK